MPRYEFMCEKCNKPFELIMTFAEREKGDVKARSAKAPRSCRRSAALWPRRGRRAERRRRRPNLSTFTAMKSNDPCWDSPWWTPSRLYVRRT